MPTFELISNPLCPYTQRAAIQLTEKGVAYERVYIDLANKPEWFLKVSPLAKVPLLRVGDVAIFETAVICEYIEMFYNRTRRHSYLGGMSPEAFEAASKRRRTCPE